MEWWYFTGHLQGKDIFGKSHEYGFEMTMIRMDALGTEPVSAIWNGHIAISDITRQTFKQDEATYSLQPDVVPAGGGFNNTVGLYHMDGKNGVNHLSGGFADLGYAGINLTLRQTQPAVLHGNAGVIPYAPFGQSGYYSQTNLKASGTLLDHGVLVNVTGTAPPRTSPPAPSPRRTSTVTGTISGANITGKAYAELTPSITLPTRGSV